VSANPEMIINVTGDPDLSNEFRSASNNRIEVIEGAGARLLWDVIEKQKKARIEAFKMMEHQKTIFNVISKIGLSGTVEDFMRQLLEKALEITSAPSGSICVLEHGKMRLIVSKGLSKAVLEKQIQDIMTSGLIKSIISTKEVISINDTLKADYTKNNPVIMRENIRALLVIPIITKDEVLGILYVNDFKPRKFTDVQKASLIVLAGFIGVSLDRFALARNVEKLNLKIKTLLESSVLS
jgi:GAF domain-containing protein